LDWQQEVERLYFDEKLSLERIADIIEPYFPDKKHQQRREKAWGYIRYHPKRKTPTQAINKPIGVIGDLHVPFDHPNYLKFLQDTFKQFNVGRKVFIGDLFDHYSYSRFTKKPLAMNPKQEKDLAKKQISKYCEAFPKADVILGNHFMSYGSCLA